MGVFRCVLWALVVPMLACVHARAHARTCAFVCLYDGAAASGRMEDGLKAEGGASHRLGMVSEHAAPCGPVRRAAASPLALHPHAQHTSAHNGLKSRVLTGEAGYIYSSHCP